MILYLGSSLINSGPSSVFLSYAVSGTLTIDWVTLIIVHGVTVHLNPICMVISI